MVLLYCLSVTVNLSACMYVSLFLSGCLFVFLSAYTCEVYEGFDAAFCFLNSLRETQREFNAIPVISGACVPEVC